MELNEIKALLKDRNLRAVADGAGVNYFKLVAWMADRTKNPDYELVTNVVKYLETTQIKAA